MKIPEEIVIRPMTLFLMMSCWNIDDDEELRQIGDEDELELMIK